MKANEARVTIKRTFDAEFGTHGTYPMVLPEDALGRESGGFEQNGWEVQYKFCTENDVEHIEFFTTHRMTNDRLYRIVAGGEVECIGSSTDGALQDADDAFYEDVRRRGFDPLA